MPNPVIIRRVPGVGGMAAGGPTITVDSYTPLNDNNSVLANGNVHDFAKPSRVFAAPQTSIVPGTGVGHITPCADFHPGNTFADRGFYTSDSSLNFAANQHFTMFAWINWNATIGFEAMMGNNNVTATSGWYMGLWVENYCMRGFDGSGTDVHFDSGVAPVLSTWTFVAGGYDGTNLWMQINAGTRLTQALAGLKAATGNYAVGNYSNSGTNHRAPDGKLGGVGMALRTLTLTEISNIYNDGVGQLPSYFI